MPKRGGRRRKKRTEKKEEVAETEKKLTPRCFVVKRGRVGERVRDLVQDFREVMLPNCARALRESKFNRLEDYAAVAGHFHVTHLIVFTSTKLASYMKMAKLPQGPTLTFRIMSFSLARDVKAAQRRPRVLKSDFTDAPLQVLNGFGGTGDDKVSCRQLQAEMLRGLLPAIDVPTFKQSNCRRTALFHHDKETELIHFRHFSVARRPAGLQRGISKLLRTRRVPKLGRREDIADFVLDGGMGASESEVEDQAEAPGAGGGKIAVRLTEIGPRLSLLLVKAEEGVCGGGVLYHRYQSKTPSQREVLEQKARQKAKLRERNKRLEEIAALKANKKKKRPRNKDDDDDDGEDGGGFGGDFTGGRSADPDSGDERKPKAAAPARKKARFHPFARKAKQGGSSEKAEAGADSGGKGGGKSGDKGLGKGRSKGGGKGGRKTGKGGGKGKEGGSRGERVLSKFRGSAKQPGK